MILSLLVAVLIKSFIWPDHTHGMHRLQPRGWAKLAVTELPGENLLSPCWAWSVLLGILLSHSHLSRTFLFFGHDLLARVFWSIFTLNALANEPFEFHRLVFMHWRVCAVAWQHYKGKIFKSSSQKCRLLHLMPNTLSVMGFFFFCLLVVIC